MPNKGSVHLVCRGCGIAFTRPPSAVGPYCSNACYFARPRFRDSLEQFLTNVTVGDGCWEWQGPRTTTGYGAVPIDGTKRIHAHRLSWQLHNGPIPDGLWVLHHCDNRPCVRPDHLFLGTNDDNQRDMYEKGRHRYEVGRLASPETKAKLSLAHRGKGKLTPEIVRAIRAAYAMAPPSLQRVATAFGISKSHVQRIVHGHVYGYI